MTELTHSRDRPSPPIRSPIHGALLVCGLVASALAAAFFACAGGPSLDSQDYHRTAAVEGAHALLGAERCDTCHGHQPAPRHHSDCESCHGSGERHVQHVMSDDGIRFPANRDCLACHETGHAGLLNWSSADHQRAGLLCADCHDPHNAEPWHARVVVGVPVDVLPNARPGTRLCVSCHADIAARLNLPSHHPVREGMVGCNDCHRPHESQTTRLGEQTAQCTQCHQSQAGPWIYEHTPVVEDCGYCHEPHGSANRVLLTASQPGACVFCHTVAEMGATHDPQAYVTRCTDCHGSVHGSYADPFLRR